MGNKNWIRKIFKPLKSWATLLILLPIFWEIFRFICIDLCGYTAITIPGTYKIGVKIIGYLGNVDFIFSYLITLSRVLLSLLIAIVMSSIIGFFLGFNNKVYIFCRPLWDFLRSIPPASMFPLFLLLLGLSGYTKIIIAIYFSTLILTLHVADLTFTILNKSHDPWQIIKISKVDLIKYQLYPQILINIVSNLRIVISIIIALIIITEMYLPIISGIGGQIIKAYNDYTFDSMYALIFFVGLLGYIITILFDKMTKNISAKYGNN